MSFIADIFGGGHSDPPPPPDPAVVAKQQAEENRKTMQMQLDNSRVGSSNAFGTSAWGKSPTTNADGSIAPNWNLTQTLSPESQGIYNQSTSKLGDALGNMSTNAGGYNQAAADAVYSRLRRYQDPADALAQNAQQSNLADRGFSVGDQAYETDRKNLNQTQQMGRADSANQAQATGYTQGMGQMSMQQQIAQTLSGIRNQQVAGVSGLTNSSTTPSIQAPDMVGMANSNYQQQVAANSAQNASSDNMFGGLLGLAGTIAGGPMGGMLASSLGGLGGLGGGGGSGYSAPSIGGGFGGQPYRSPDALDAPSRRGFYN